MFYEESSCSRLYDELSSFSVHCNTTKDTNEIIVCLRKRVRVKKENRSFLTRIETIFHRDKVKFSVSVESSSFSFGSVSNAQLSTFRARSFSILRKRIRYKLSRIFISRTCRSNRDNVLLTGFRFWYSTILPFIPVYILLSSRN